MQATHPPTCQAPRTQIMYLNAGFRSPSSIFSYSVSAPLTVLALRLFSHATSAAYAQQLAALRQRKPMQMAWPGRYPGASLLRKL